MEPRNAMEAFPNPNATCAWPDCTRRHATLVADLPFCFDHAEEAVKLLLTGDVNRA